MLINGERKGLYLREFITGLKKAFKKSKIAVIKILSEFTPFFKLQNVVKN